MSPPGPVGAGPDSSLTRRLSAAYNDTDMSLDGSIACVRCGHRNVPRARYCAHCGINLLTAGADQVTRVVRRHHRRSGSGVVVALLLLGLILAGLALIFRARPHRVILPPHSVEIPFSIDLPLSAPRSNLFMHEHARRVPVESPSPWQIQRLNRRPFSCERAD